ncbi:hypothetical protein HNQ87_000630 [Pacificimonas flava]|nr:hypothetical protein [Pacificimonas flava]
MRLEHRQARASFGRRMRPRGVGSDSRELSESFTGQPPSDLRFLALSWLGGMVFVLTMIA